MLRSILALRSLVFCCSVLCCAVLRCFLSRLESRHEEREKNTTKGQTFVCFQADDDSAQIPPPEMRCCQLFFPSSFPSSSAILLCCDIFPTWKQQTGYLTNCTQANLYGKNYYLTSIHYNASCLVFGWYPSERINERASSNGIGNSEGRARRE